MNVLELGCGLNPSENATVRHDLWAHSPYVDVTSDLDYVPWRFEIATCRNLEGDLFDDDYYMELHWFKREVFDQIIAQDVFEHLSISPVEYLGECWKLLKPGGHLIIQVPEWGGYNHRTDPTHVRGFTLESFDYFVPSTFWFNADGRIYDQEQRYWRMYQKHKKDGNLIFIMEKIGYGSPDGDEQPNYEGEAVG